MVKTSALGSGRPEVPPQIHPLQLWAVEGVLQPGASVTPLVSGGERGVPLMEPHPILTALCFPTSHLPGAVLAGPWEPPSASGCQPETPG